MTLFKPISAGKYLGESIDQAVRNNRGLWLSRNRWNVVEMRQNDVRNVERNAISFSWHGRCGDCCSPRDYHRGAITGGLWCP